MRATQRQADKFKRDFGRRVRLLRTRAGISQEELAKRAELHPTHISQIERGRRNVWLVTVHSLAIGLDVPAGALFERPTRRAAGASRAASAQGK